MALLLKLTFALVKFFWDTCRVGVWYAWSTILVGKSAPEHAPGPDDESLRRGRYDILERSLMRSVINGVPLPDTTRADIVILSLEMSGITVHGDLEGVLLAPDRI